MPGERGGGSQVQPGRQTPLSIVLSVLRLVLFEAVVDRTVRRVMHSNLYESVGLSQIVLVHSAIDCQTTRPTQQAQHSSPACTSRPNTVSTVTTARVHQNSIGMYSHFEGLPSCQLRLKSRAGHREHDEYRLVLRALPALPHQHAQAVEHCRS
jgi:hypothetical protein